MKDSLRRTFVSLQARTILSGFLWVGAPTLVSSFITGCGPSNFFRNFQDASNKQDDINEGVLSIWNRSPTADSRDYTLTVGGNLDAVPRAKMSFAGLLDVNGPLESSDITVMDSASLLGSTTFFNWAGRKAMWDTPDFQLLMAYAHATKALNYGKALFPTANYSFVPVGSDGKALSESRLRIFAVEAGDVFATSYDPTSKSISFYRLGGTGPFAQFNPILEADSIYHEIGHFVMHALTCPENSDCASHGGRVGSPVSMTFGQIPDLDALQEGLADFYAAAVASDERLMTFFNNNMRNLISPSNRTGIDFYRSINNTLSFPDAFRQEAHLDGRVIAGALNDFRKYLIGDNVQKTNCTSSCYIAGRSSPLSKANAAATVVGLAFESFAAMTRTSNFYQFSSQMIEYCQTTTLCPDNTEAPTVLQSILLARGLYSESPISATSTLGFSTDQNAASFYVDTTLAWKPFPDNSTLADTDGFLEPCELVAVYPDITNLTGLIGRPLAQLESLRAVLTEASGFTEPVVNGLKLDPLPAPGASASNYSTKLLGWLDKGESFKTNLFDDSSSRLYSVAGLSTFTKAFGKSFNVPTSAWLVHAPSTYGATGTLKIRFDAAVANNQSGGTVLSSSVVTLTLSTITSAQRAAELAANANAKITSYATSLSTCSIQ